jgi:hypothetical protein
VYQGAEAAVLLRTLLDIRRKRGLAGLQSFLRLLADDTSNNYRIAEEFDLRVFSVAVARRAIHQVSLDLLLYLLSFSGPAHALTRVLLKESNSDTTTN